MTAKRKKHWSDKLVEMGACAEAVRWARKQPSFKAAWWTCTYSDWMCWLLWRMRRTTGWPTWRRVVAAQGRAAGKCSWVDLYAERDAAFCAEYRKLKVPARL